MHYEHAEGYPPFEPTLPNGEPRRYGFFGYPDQMLCLAMTRDDPEGYRFYFDRHFSLDGMTLGGSHVLIAANKGAVNITKGLISMGATDPAYSAEELVARAEKVKATP